MGNARAREEGDRCRGEGATGMGEMADRETVGDVAEDSGSHGDQVQAVLKRRHDAWSKQDRDTGRDRQRGGVDRLLQDARVLREG